MRGTWCQWKGQRFSCCLTIWDATPHSTSDIEGVRSSCSVRSLVSGLLTSEGAYELLMSLRHNLQVILWRFCLSTTTLGRHGILREVLFQWLVQCMKWPVEVELFVENSWNSKARRRRKRNNCATEESSSIYLWVLCCSLFVSRLLIIAG